MHITVPLLNGDPLQSDHSWNNQKKSYRSAIWWSMVLMLPMSMVLFVLVLMPSESAISARHFVWRFLSMSDSTVMESVEQDVLPATTAIPWLTISGGPQALPRNRVWVPRVCTPAYEGPHCSNTTSWRGVVTLHLGNMSITNVKMHTRGHVSTMFPKHQFSLKLPEPMSLLNMAPARKWVLATSFADTSFQRNPTAFDIYRSVGGWATQTRYVNVQWGKDFGLYYIGERIERGKGRLNIPKAHPRHAKKSGYLMTIDWAKPGKTAIKSETTSTYFSALYPQKISQKQERFLQNLLNTIDARAAAAAATTVGTVDASAMPSLEEVVDFASFARFFITEELAKDVDGYAFSVYVRIESGRLFHAAPWDFDLGFNFACMPIYFRNAFTGKAVLGSQGWNVENLRDNSMWIGPEGFPGGSIKYFGLNKRQFFLNMWEHPKFIETFVAAWKEARRGALSDHALKKMVLTRSAEISLSAKRDMAIWNQTNRCAFWTCCEPGDIHSFKLSYEHLLQYLLDRAAWIDANVGGLIKS